MAALGGAEKCPRCKQNVYFAEEAKAMGRKYHKTCLKCVECNKTLDSTNCNDHEEEIYCNGCYRRNFGIHSSSHSAHTAGSPTEPEKPVRGPTVISPNADLCFRCNKVVYMAERISGGLKFFHKSCFKCNTCSVSLDSNRLSIHEDEIYCNACYGKNFGPKGYGFAGGASGLSMDTGKADEVATSHIPATAQAHLAPLMDNGEQDGGGQGDWTDNKERCNRCKKVVYFAERVASNGQIYHKPCFKCQNCNKSLDSTTLTEHEGEIYCKSCYGRSFGPKGFGFRSSMVTEEA